MTRKAIMIGSPGPKNSATYLKGVDTDLHHFVSFLKSPVGGSWEDEEIAGFYNGPSEYLIELFQRTNTDFLLVYFSGHGYQDSDETNIAINDTESISISQLISLIKAPKALIIIDCCRKFIDEAYSSFSGPEYLSFKSLLDQPNTRDRYMQLISESTNGVAIAYSCSVGEYSGDTELGGSYTYSLLKTSLQWNERQYEEDVLSISVANDLAHEYLKIKTHFQQNPQIRMLSAKSENLNLPFAIKASSH
jgi:Caspase domain